jgi:hypothetical protein
VRPFEGIILGAGLIDQDECQAVLDAMPRAGWRLASSFVEMNNGSTLDLCMLLEQEVTESTPKTDEEELIAMGWVKCSHGHYYPPNTYDTRPTCAQQVRYCGHGNEIPEGHKWCPVCGLGHNPKVRGPEGQA